MFNECITSTAFTDEMANEFFYNKIYLGDPGFKAAENKYDTSFLSTCRALLMNRCEGNQIAIINNSLNMLTGDIEESTLDSLSRIHDKINANIRSGISDTIMIYNIKGSYERTSRFFEVADEYYKTHKFSGFEKIEKISVYFNTFNVIAYANKYNKTTIVFAQRLNCKKYHLLQSAIFALLPWYYNSETNPATELEMKLLNSLRCDSSSDYLETLQQMASNINFKESYIRRSISGFQSGYIKRQVNNVTNILADLRYDEADLHERLSRVHQEIQNNELRLLALSLSDKDKDDEELVEYILNSKNIEFVSANDNNSFVVDIDSYISNWDESLAERSINNFGSLVYEGVGLSDKEICGEDAKLLLTEIFINQNIYIKTWGRFVVSESDIEASRHPNNDRLNKIAYANPHLCHYACRGQNRTEIIDAVGRGDYIYALAVCVSSVGNLNFGDPSVMPYFSKELFGAHRIKTAFLELPNGTKMTVDEAIEYIKSGGKNEQEN